MDLETTFPHGAEGSYRHHYGGVVSSESLLKDVWAYFVSTGTDNSIHNELHRSACCNHGKEESCCNPEISVLRPLKEIESEDMILFQLLNKAAKHGWYASHNNSGLCGFLWLEGIRREDDNYGRNGMTALGDALASMGTEITMKALMTSGVSRIDMVNILAKLALMDT